MRFALEQILSVPPDAEDCALRAWKLWLVLPRLLLHRPPGQDKLPKPLLLGRFDAFIAGRWSDLLGQCRGSCTQLAES